MRFGTISVILQLICIFIARSQQIEEISLGVKIPQDMQELTQSQSTLLKAKIMQIVASSGDIAVGYDNGFVVYPILSIEQAGIVEGGLQKIVVTNVTVILQIRQIITGKTFATITKKISGHGSSKENSITNALNKISTTDKDFLQFVTSGKNAVNDYYNVNCSVLLQDAKHLENLKDYEQSLTILQSIPRSAKCYNDAKQKAINLYNKYQKIYCTKIISNAKGAVALKDYSRAIELLTYIEPQSPCSTEAEKIVSAISDKIDKQMHREYSLQERRIDAIREICKTYYSNKVITLKW